MKIITNKKRLYLQSLFVYSKYTFVIFISYYSFFKSLNTCGELPQEDIFGIDKKRYGYVLKTMEHANLIFDIDVSFCGKEDKTINLNISRAKITIAGIEYLKNNE